MKERPILFSALMVRAILDGRKTQTRRIIKPQPPAGVAVHALGGGAIFMDWVDGGPAAAAMNPQPQCPYGKVGDQLWVRENFKTDSQVDDVPPSELSQGEPILYIADNVYRQTGCAPIEWGKTRPNIFLPKWASRILLEITDVRVQRLQDISDEDAKREGCGMHEDMSAYQEFYELWSSINGPESWEANLWCWVIEFRVQP